MSLALVVGFADSTVDADLLEYQRHEVTDAVAYLDDAESAPVVASGMPDASSDEFGDITEEAVTMLAEFARRHCTDSAVLALVASVDAVGPDGIVLPVSAGALRRDGACPTSLGSSGDIAAVLRAVDEAGLPPELDSALFPLREAVADSLERGLPLFVQ